MTKEKPAEEPVASVAAVGKAPPAPGVPVALPDPVRLVASARFYTETLLVPPGISARDLHGFLEGEVEELSMFPLEATAWGYLDSRRKPSGGSILLYAAFREHLNGATASDSARRFAVLPGFAVLLNRQWKKTTWLVLVESECVTLVRFPARATIPDYVRSRYGTRLDEHLEEAWALRAELLESAPCTEEDRVEDGLVRCGIPTVDRRAMIRFPLEQQRRPDAAWKRFGIGQIGSESVLLAADVRERKFLQEERSRRRAIRQLRGFLRLAVLVLLLLTAFQYQYIRRSRETTALVAKAKSQRATVKALQEQEALAKSAARLSEPPPEIFDWLMAVNESRPETIAFHTAYADRDGNLGLIGEAPSVLVVNQYREALEKTDRCAEVELKEINSAKRGVKFTIRVHMRPETAAAAKPEDAS